MLIKNCIRDPRNIAYCFHLLHLYNVKCHFGWSNKSFDVLLKLLKDVFLKGETLPGSMIEARKVVDGLSLYYEKIYAYPNDWIWKENASATECTICHASRWKVHRDKKDGVIKRKKKAIPVKVLRYFPSSEGCKDCSYWWNGQRHGVTSERTQKRWHFKASNWLSSLEAPWCIISSLWCWIPKI